MADAGGANRIPGEGRGAVDAVGGEIRCTDEVRLHDVGLAEARAIREGAPFVVQQVQEVLDIQLELDPVLPDVALKARDGGQILL